MFASRRLVPTRLEQASDVTERNFDLGEIGLENRRQLMKRIEQQLLVLGEAVFLLAAAGEPIADGVVGHYSRSFFSKAINPIYGDFEVNNCVLGMGTPSQTNYKRARAACSRPGTMTG